MKHGGMRERGANRLVCHIVALQAKRKFQVATELDWYTFRADPSNGGR